MGTPHIDAIPNNCTIYSHRIEDTDLSSEITLNCTSLCDSSIHFMNEIYTFSATTKQIVKFERMPNVYMKSNRFKIEPYNSS